MRDPFDQTLVHLAVRHSSATQVFRETGLDFWSEGRRTLAEVCAKHGCEPAGVLARIRDRDAHCGPCPNWHRRPLSELIEHLVGTEHPLLRRTLDAITRSFVADRSDMWVDPVRSRLSERLEIMASDLDLHMRKEETVLFPVILEGRATRSVESIHVMEVEHADHVGAIRRLREILVDGAQQSPGEDHGLLAQIETYEALVIDHIHLENNILFPRAFFECDDR